jgi:hypothetical protein
MAAGEQERCRSLRVGRIEPYLYLLGIVRLAFLPPPSAATSRLVEPVSNAATGR